MTQVLARKWRPKTFGELVGQEHVVQALTNALKQQRLHHAYLFTGTRGVGKTTLARIIAKALNCETGVADQPCGQCAACREIDAGRFVDLIELDAASNTQVDNMRELLDNAVYAPTAGRYKIYIIDEVHMLSRSAFNAMLKTLEEPPAHVKFILATTDPQKIPVTVLSRCLQFNLKHIPRQQIAGQLQRVLEQEGVAFESGALALLARAAQGSMRDGLSLLDQAIAHGGGRVDEASVRSMLGAVEQDYLYGILRALAQGDGAGMMAQADRMAEFGVSFDAALQDLASLLHRVALAQSIPAAIAEDAPDRGIVLELAGALPAEDVQLYYQIALQGRQDFGWAPDDYAGFTMVLLRLLAFRPDSGGGAANRAIAPRAVPAPNAASRTESTPSSGLRGSSAREPVRAIPVRPATGPSEIKPVSTSGGAPPADWRELVETLKLGGMAGMLAQHCELIARDGLRFDLRLPSAHKHLLEKAYQDKLKAALGARLGGAVRLNFAIGEGSGNTPAELESREAQVRLNNAVAAIEADPFVRELVDDFDARIVESSIKPLQ